jgi:hypothetical protein
MQDYNLFVVLHGFETWDLTMREEYRLRVFEQKLSAREGPGSRRLGEFAQ